jgi:uncharacterized protein (DUF924 family)
MPTTWVDDIQNFWFRDLGPQAWFAADAQLDEVCRARFLKIHATLAADFVLADAVSSPERVVASVILFDQFPRNMFRGTARAFATDPLARAVAGEAIERALDVGLDKDRRLFLYLPFEHSEDHADQERSVELFQKLGDDEWLKYAIDHRDIIARFGRFPHRNAALGRPSTPEEQAFLKAFEGF